MPAGVSVCVCVPSAEPVKVSAGTVRLGAVAEQAVAPLVPIFAVDAQLPVVVVLPFVPAGVPAETADVVWLVLPVNVGCDTAPVGVIVAEPPDAPTSPLAASVPCRNFPFNAATSLHVAGQVPLATIVISPEGIPLEDPLLSIGPPHVPLTGHT